MRFRQYSRIVLIATLALSVAGVSRAQIPDKFTNLKIFPKDTGKRELVSAMRKFSGALGKRCNYCHVGESTTSLEGYDFASDEKEPKRVARAMMKMVADINNVHIAGLKREHAVTVGCNTCHRGVSEPEMIEDVVLEAAEKDGVDAAIAKYRELREEYYGSASYDFSAGPLGEVAERLAQEKGDMPGAISVMKANIEFHPDEALAHMMLGRLYMASGDKDAAIASFEKSLVIDPDNRWANQMLERIRSSK